MIAGCTCWRQAQSTSSRLRVIQQCRWRGSSAALLHQRRVRSRRKVCLHRGSRESRSALEATRRGRSKRAKGCGHGPTGGAAMTDMKPEATESLSRLHAAIAGVAEEVAAAMPVSDVLFGNLLDAFPILMWATTPDGVPWYLNHRCGDYTGRSMSDVLRLGWVDLIHPEDREETLRSWAHAGQSGRAACR